MRLYNTLTRSEEPFAPSSDDTVRIYTCGLTVYARGHIGNFRTFVCVDVLRRTLKTLLGYRVRQVINFTDVDDRTILGAQKAGMDLRAYTDRYIGMFREDARALGLEEVEERPRATDEHNLQAMAELIRSLERRGHTYISDGSIYFKISSWPDYGKLARLDHDGMKPGARVDADSYAKEDARDFVLWKAAKPGEPSWDVVDPPGRPGWHLECSAMALRLLGDPPIDIHAGGIDLIFPHHENEIAQSEGATGKPFARFWMHVEYLIVDEQKMSKSLGNTYTIPDVVAKGFRPSAVRFLLLSAHYRKQLNFTWDSLAAAEESLRRLLDFLTRLDGVSRDGSNPAIAQRVEEARKAFSDAMFDDLNTAAALGAIFELVRALNSAIDAGQVGTGDVSVIREAFDQFDRVLGVIGLRRAEEDQPPVPVDEIERLIEDRHAARRRRDFAAADAVRNDLAARGVLLEDGPGRHALEAEMSDAPSIKTTLPGPRAKALIERDNAVVSPSYTRGYPLVIARGYGSMVEDVDGNVFLDCAAGIAVNSTGHAHPAVVKAITDQAQKFLHMSGTDFYYEPQVRLAEELSSIAPIAGGSRSFFGNSGTEAIEASIKLARYASGRQNIIAFLGGFHGRSMGSLSLTASKAIQRRGFGPLMPGVYHAPYADCYRCPLGLKPESCAAECLDYLEHQIFVHLVTPDEVAAIVVEPIQGEGGYIVAPDQFSGLRELTTRHGILLVADEVQSGMGRSGRMFAIEYTSVEPDIVAIAKGIASGLPLGVAVARRDLMAWPPGSHASTFGGNPVSCAAAIETIALLKSQLVANAADVGAHLKSALAALADRHPLIGDVRGRGLMVGVELVRDRQTKERATEERDAVVSACFARGLLLLGAGKNAIRFSPPLVLTRAQADMAVRIFDEALGEVERQRR